MAMGRSALVRIAVLLLAATAVAAAARAHVGLELVAHRRIPSRAIVAGTLGGELEAASSDWRPRSTAELIRFALERTRDHLVPRPAHATDPTFLNDVRPANSEEYSQLFAAVLRHVGELRDVPRQATIFRSELRWFGFVPPWAGGRTHDWVRVEDGRGRTWSVDPMLDDMGLGWDVSGDVRPVR